MMSNYRNEMLRKMIVINTIIMLGGLVFAAVCLYNSIAIGGIVGIATFAFEAFYIDHLHNCREGWTVFDIDPETGEEVEYKVYPRI